MCKSQGLTDEDMLADVQSYATTLGKNHALAGELQLDLKNPDYAWATRCVVLHTPEDTLTDYHEQYNVLKNLGFSDERLQDAITKAREYKGVILGIKATVPTDFKIDQATDLVIPAGSSGLPLKYISGIKALGQHEQAYFAILK